MTLLLLFVGIVVTVNTSWFKTKLVHEITALLSRELNYPVSIASAEISYFNAVSLHNTLIKDTYKKEMIHIADANISFDLITLLNKKIVIEEIFLYKPHVNLIKNNTDGNLNINEFIKTIKGRFANVKKNKNKPKFTINAISISEGYFSFYDERKDDLEDIFDYYHFELEHINASATNFLFEDNITSMQVSGLSLIEPSYNKTVKDLSAKLAIGLDFIELADFTAQIGNSTIKDFIRFDFENYSAFDDFNRNVNITAHLQGAMIESNDISMFSSSLRDNIKDTWKVSGTYKGTVVSFASKDFDIEFGNNSEVSGKMRMDGLPDFFNTFVDVTLTNSHIKSNDLAQYFPTPSARKQLQKFGHIVANGNFLGFPLDFVAYGDFETSLGRLTSDINLKIDREAEKAYYKGKLKTPNFNLGKLTGYNNYLGKINMNGQIEGTGLTLKTATFDLNANINSIRILQYSYSNIKTNAHFSSQRFDGDLVVNDTNLQFTANGLIDFTKSQPIIKISSNIAKSNLYELGLTTIQSTMKSQIDMNIKGSTIDDLVGVAKFDDLKVTYDSNYLDLTSITLFSSLLRKERNLSAISPYFVFKMNGDFTFSRLSQDLLTLRDELLLGLENDRDKINDYYQKKGVDTTNYRINYELDIADANPLLELYSIDADISKNTFVSGSFKQSSNTIFTLGTEVEKFRYQDVELNRTIVDVNSSKFKNSSEILAFGLIESQSQKTKGFETEDLHLEAVWSENQLNFETYVKQKESTNNISLISTVNFEEEQTNVKLNELQLSVYDQIWSMLDSNSIVIRKGDFTFTNLQFSNHVQKISLSGEISEDPSKNANLVIENFNLNLLNPLLPQPIYGKVQLDLVLNDIFKKRNVRGILSVDSFHVANNYLGEIQGQTHWNEKTEEAFMGLLITKNNKEVAKIKGNIYPNRTVGNFDVTADIVSTDLVYIQPYFTKYVSHMDGKFSGKAHLTGEFNYPVLAGQMDLESASFTYDYLNVRYHSSGSITFDKDVITFPAVTLQDDFNNKATINGKITHTAFALYNNDLHIQFTNLLTLNTTAENNDLYFGKVFSTGEAFITGPISDISIKAKAYTNKNTEIYIPLNGYEGVEDKDFIRFISFNKKSDKGNAPSAVDLTGINMDFNFEITSDAYMQIIFDAKAGDIIRGKGNGKLNLVIDTRGEFSMYGDYEIEQGEYNFTLLNIVNKEFSIEKGSLVKWNGDPYQASLDIMAKYRQRASLAPIILDSTVWINNPSFKTKKYPTDVVLNLKGDLLHPQINLDIDINKEYPRQLESDVTSFQNDIKNNEQELNRQVFSLIILKQFAQRNSFSGLNLGASAGRSMSELISNQLSYWMSQVDDNLEIDLDVGSLSAADNSSYQLRLTYSLLDGRLRLSNQTDYDKGADLSSITGEWMMEYMVTKDGKLRLKMYNRTSQNNYSNDINNSTYSTAGASIMYTKGFDSLKDIFRKKDKKN